MSLFGEGAGRGNKTNYFKKETVHFKIVIRFMSLFGEGVGRGNKTNYFKIDNCTF